MKNSLALIVATKDRPGEIKKLLDSLNSQTCRPDQLIIVDGGTKLAQQVIRNYPKLNICYLRCIPPSAAKQRNFGIKAVKRDTNLIGFLDDDTVLEEKSIEEMMHFWEKADPDIGGAGFNLMNGPPLNFSRPKSIVLARRLGFYSNRVGAVLASGFQTIFKKVSEITAVEWLGSGAVVWRRKILDNYQFDEWFKGYSYLEDLDFSYRVGKQYKLVVVANAKFCHYPAASGRENGEIFGKREVVNRIYFVKKNKEISLIKCYLAIFLRIFLNLVMGIKQLNIDYFERIKGNVEGLFEEFRKALILR